MVHPSLSTEQQAAESEILAEASRKLGVELQRNAKRINGCQVDGYADLGGTIFVVECYARIGKLKAAQLKKVDSDVLKLALCSATLRTQSPDKHVRAIVVFTDDSALQSYSRGWRMKAVVWANVEFLVACPKDETRAAICAAQARQCMVNSTK